MNEQNSTFSIGDPGVRRFLWCFAGVAREVHGPGMVLMEAGGQPGYATRAQLAELGMPEYIIGWAVAAHSRPGHERAVIHLQDPSHPLGGSIYFLDAQLDCTDVIAALCDHYQAAVYRRR